MFTIGDCFVEHLIQLFTNLRLRKSKTQNGLNQNNCIELQCGIFLFIKFIGA